ncbi:hypothetical protein DICPUDRAFT_150114 [Dictyostelium purpureum]|uniref:WWE domain-containing protein n=1 Tax=Dictyostelium purpureum TaxID=5786 RepID=F0ZFH0_DICPU|nr:uncharacterized protein DICPUDRAFT_150114 [Dictyostelium purpureum]EGC37297.1 hypothetical protein DICPUDRAFT_150114 [Dictyostelium purpureum]|eukprot:XP_003286185.1 hypothetical protein DICPUDRAFT_150114 [Dictyostelium purpureum]
MEYRLIDSSDFNYDICSLISNKQIISNLKERNEIINIISKISNKLYILCINDLLRYCEDALINFEAFSKELTKKDKEEMTIWAWQSKTWDPENPKEYNYYISKKIELAFLKKYQYFKISDIHFVDFVTLFQRRIENIDLKRKVTRITLEERKTKEKSNNENKNLNTKKNIKKNIKTNNNIENTDNNLDINNIIDNIDYIDNKINDDGDDGDKSEYYTKWYWSKSILAKRKNSTEFSKSNCKKLENAFLFGLSCVKIGNNVIYFKNMCLKKENEKFSSFYILRKPKFEPLTIYNSLKKEEYEILKSKIELFLIIQQQLKVEKEKEEKEEKEEIEGESSTKISISPCLKTTLENFIESIINNNKKHVAEKNFL